MPTEELHFRHFISEIVVMSISQRLVMDNVLQSLPHPMQERYLYITGRMKEIIITASGEKVPPRPIEEAIKRELPLISNAIVIGDQQRFLCCLVTLKVRYIRTRRFQDRFSGQPLQTEVDEETGVPTDRLSEMALSCCQAAGSSAHTVGEVVGGEGDRKVLKMIQHGIDRVNKAAASRIQKASHTPFVLATPTNDVMCFTDCQVVNSGARLLSSRRRAE